MFEFTRAFTPGKPDWLLRLDNVFSSNVSRRLSVQMLPRSCGQPGDGAQSLRSVCAERSPSTVATVSEWVPRCAQRLRPPGTPKPNMAQKDQNSQNHLKVSCQENAPVIAKHLEIMDGQNNGDHFSKLPPEMVAYIIDIIDDERSKNSLRETSKYFQEVVESLPNSGKDWYVINDINRRVSSLRELQVWDRADAIAGIGQGGLQHLDAEQRGQVVAGALELQGGARARAIGGILRDSFSISALKELGVQPFKTKDAYLQETSAHLPADITPARYDSLEAAREQMPPGAARDATTANLAAVLLRMSPADITPARYNLLEAAREQMPPGAARDATTANLALVRKRQTEALPLATRGKRAAELAANRLLGNSNTREAIKQKYKGR